MAPVDGTDAASSLDVPEDSDGAELLGQVIDGRYRLDATLGRGGMGLVFRATHQGLRRQVAVKILHPSLASASDVKSRFEREALAVGKIDHPNCVSTYDVGRLPDGSLYLAMELLEGESLADVLEREGQLAPGRALHILAHILRGLGGIHAAGLIHRDIKPENIYLIRHGDDLDFAKILDFGIAKPIRGELSDDNVKLTQAGVAFGTPIYMAPEQALGNPMDGRSDLYAAAVIGYEMLCGNPPFYSEDKLEVMSQHAARPVPPMSRRLVPGGTPVPSSLEKLVLRGLTKKPGDRYPTVEVFLAAVEQALATSDGDQTSVDIPRRPGDTGRQPLVSASGDLALEDDRFAITSAIEEALAVAPDAASSRLEPSPSPGAAFARHRTSQAAMPLGRHPTASPLPGGGQAVHPGSSLTVAGPPTDLPYSGLGGPGGATAPTYPSAARVGLARSGRHRTHLVVGLLVGAVAFGAAFAVLSGARDGGRRGADATQPRLDPRTPAGAAAEMLARGEVDSAIQTLEAQQSALAADSKAQLVLGHARAARNDGAQALAAYRAAIALEPGLEANKTLRANLRAMSADKDPDIIMHALDMWISTRDPEARTALLQAVESNRIARRHAAIEVMDLHKLGTALDRIKAYTLDLQDQPTCPQRAEAVARLRAIGDARAIPALQRAILAKGKTGAYRNKPINACLVDDAKAAIAYLETLQKP